MVPFAVRLGLSVQRALSHLFFPVLGTGIVAALCIRGHRIDGRPELRRRFAEIAQQHRGPLLICPNHLTMVDSVLLDYALASNWTYLLRFRLLPWNIPEWQNFRSNLGLRLICYLTKCTPIQRNGPPEEKRALLDKLEWLLNEGDSVCIFPEGTRSKTGRLDMETFGYGVGQLATRVPSAAILCVYVRGETQVATSGIPNRGDPIHADVKLIHPTSRHRGLRAARDISVQVMNTLHGMEEKYFREMPSGEPASSLQLEPAE